MSITDNSSNGTGVSAAAASEPSEPTSSQNSTHLLNVPTVDGRGDAQPKFATRADVKTAEGVSKGKLLLLAGGLAVAVLFFVFTAIAGKSPKRPKAQKQAPHSQQSQTEQKPTPKDSLTPVMDVPRTLSPDNTAGQLGPADIRRTRTLDTGAAYKPPAAKPAAANSLGAVPSFADTQQKWEDPSPYNGTQPTEIQQSQQNALKEPSLVFVHNQTQNQTTATASPLTTNGDDSPRLELTPGTRIQAKLETQISSAVQAPVVAVVEYTYAIGERVIIPAGARVYGQLQQADRSGLVSVKFNEIELLDGAREAIDAVGTGLDLGPIKGNVYGKNTGKNFIVRAASGLGSVLAEVAGNNTSAAFSEDDMLRERLAENIGTAGDSEVMSLSANSRVVVSVPADTKIYVVFTKHEPSPAELHKVAPVAQ